MKSRLLNKFLNGWKLQDHYVKKLLEQKDSPFKTWDKKYRKQ